MIKLGQTMAAAFTPGALPKFSSVGCYPLFYIVSGWRCDEQHVWCARCCNEADDSMCTIVQCEANWEDPELYCEACEERIESAYAESEEA